MDTGQTFVIRMRSDIKPFDDVKVRQAMMKCFDRQKMLDLAWFGEGILGHRHPRHAGASGVLRESRSRPTIRKAPRSCWPKQATQTASRSS